MTHPLPVVDTPDEFVTFEREFPHFFKALHGKAPVRIVAMGSSSTAGRADVVPYPARLEMYLRWQYQERFTELRLDVLNRGKGGQEAIEEVDRFTPDIFELNPSLVIWQLGTNAVFRNYKIPDVVDAIDRGLQKMHGQEFDVILMDPQYVPQMLYDGKADTSEDMVRLIAAAAKKWDVALFRRWALMRHWHVHNNVALADMIDPTDGDKLHQSDWSTMQISKALFAAIHKVFMSMV